MPGPTVRILLALLTCVALAAGGAVGGVAADHDDGEYDADLTLEGSADSAEGGGNGTYDCVGDVTFRHHCDKDAGMEAGPASVGYFGDNWAQPSELQGGGGDVFTVAAGEENVTVGFDCHLQASPDQPCGAVTDADDYDGDRD